MPIVRLTAKNVPTLPPVDGHLTDYVDSFLPGFVLRVTPAGHRAYGIRWKGRRLSLGDAKRVPLAVAREQARKALDRTVKGLDPDQLAPAHSGALTVAQLVERCLEDLELRPTTRREWERLLRVEIAPALGARLASDLRRADVREWIRGIRARSGWVANHALEVLRRAYSWARREELLEHSPCDHMPKPFHAPRSERVLSAEELWALLRNLDRARRRWLAYSDATHLLLLTGVRQAAVLGLCRNELEDLDGPDPRWIVPGGPKGRSKSGLAHVVPLSPPALVVLRRRLETVATEHLFPRRGVAEEPMVWTGHWGAWLRRHVERSVNARRRQKGSPQSEVPRWTFHGLRHAMATHLREDLQAPPDIVSLLLGHTIAGPSVSRVYDRAERLPERRRALEGWAAWLEALQKPPEGPGRLLRFSR